MTLPPSTKNGQEPKVCVKYAGPMERWNDALVTPCEGQSRRRLSPLRLSANTAMLRTACCLCVIGHRELLKDVGKMKEPERGEIFLVKMYGRRGTEFRGHEPKMERPCLIISSDDVNKSRPRLTI